MVNIGCDKNARDEHPSGVWFLRLTAYQYYTLTIQLCPTLPYLQHRHVPPCVSATLRYMSPLNICHPWTPTTYLGSCRQAPSHGLLVVSYHSHTHRENMKMCFC